MEGSNEFEDWVSSNENCLQPEFRSPADKLYYDLLVIRDNFNKGPLLNVYKDAGHNSDGFFYVDKTTGKETQFPEGVQNYFKSRNLNLNDEDWRIKMFKSLSSLKDIDTFTSTTLTT